MTRINYKICFIALMAICALGALPNAAKDSTDSANNKNSVKWFIFTEECFDLIIEKHLLSVPCLRLTFSKLIGLAIVAASAIVKLPQIIKIFKNSSVAGLSLISLFFDIIMLTLTLGYNMHYNNPFSTYGEAALILVQCYMLYLQFGLYSKEKNNKLYMTIMVVVYSSIVYTIFGNVLPESFFEMVQIISIVMNISARTPQIWMNFKNGNTGQLAFVTIFLNFAGTAARIFTTLTEVKDNLLLISCVIAFTLNTILLIQMLYYWNNDINKLTPSATDTGAKQTSEGSPTKRGSSAKRPKRE